MCERNRATHPKLLSSVLVYVLLHSRFLRCYLKNPLRHLNYSTSWTVAFSLLVTGLHDSPQHSCYGYGWPLFYLLYTHLSILKYYWNKNIENDFIIGREPFGFPMPYHYCVTTFSYRLMHIGPQTEAFDTLFPRAQAAPREASI